MAEGDCSIHNNFKEQLFKKTIDCVNDSFKVALYDAAYSWSIDGADSAYSATNELVASGYTAGGSVIANPAVTQDDTNDWGKWDADDLTWSSLGAGTVQHAVLYDDTTGTKWIICHFEIATNPNGGNFTLAFGANGIITIS